MVEYSPSREFDRKLRINVLEIMQILVRTYHRTRNPYFLQQAKEYGRLSKQLAEKIVVHNYEESDRIHYKFMIS